MRSITLAALLGCGSLACKVHGVPQTTTYGGAQAQEMRSPLESFSAMILLHSGDSVSAAFAGLPAFVYPFGEIPLRMEEMKSLSFTDEGDAVAVFWDGARVVGRLRDDPLACNLYKRKLVLKEVDSIVFAQSGQHSLKLHKGTHQLTLANGHEFPVEILDESITVVEGAKCRMIPASSLLDVSFNGALCGKISGQDGRQQELSLVFLKNPYLSVRLPQGKDIVKLPWKNIAQVQKIESTPLETVPVSSAKDPGKKEPEALFSTQGLLDSHEEIVFIDEPRPLFTLAESGYEAADLDEILVLGVDFDLEEWGPEDANGNEQQEEDEFQFVKSLPANAQHLAVGVDFDLDDHGEGDEIKAPAAEDDFEFVYNAENRFLRRPIAATRTVRPTDEDSDTVRQSRQLDQRIAELMKGYETIYVQAAAFLEEKSEGPVAEAVAPKGVPSVEAMAERVARQSALQGRIERISKANEKLALKARGTSRLHRSLQGFTAKVSREQVKNVRDEVAMMQPRRDGAAEGANGTKMTRPENRQINRTAGQSDRKERQQSASAESSLKGMFSGMVYVAEAGLQHPGFFVLPRKVTNREYGRFVAAVGYRHPVHWFQGRIPEGQEENPVVNISYRDAFLFAVWSGARLPTIEELERAGLHKELLQDAADGIAEWTATPASEAHGAARGHFVWNQDAEEARRNEVFDSRTGFRLVSDGS